MWLLTHLYKKHRLRRMAKSFLVEQKVNKISTFLFHIPSFISHPLYLPIPIATVPSHVHPFPFSSPFPVSSHSKNPCVCRCGSWDFLLARNLVWSTACECKEAHSSFTLLAGSLDLWRNSRVGVFNEKQLDTGTDTALSNTRSLR